MSGIVLNEVKNMSEPKMPSNPSDTSEPTHIRKPVRVSELGESSELGLISKPTHFSEPSTLSKPYAASESPETPRKPSWLSEPSCESNPEADSEPKEHNNPRLKSGDSEPKIASNPSVYNKPNPSRKPEGKSEPCVQSNPTFKSDFNREAVRNLVEIYYDVQDVRIRSFNRLRQVGEVKGVNPNLLKELEKQVKDYITHEIKNLPIYKNFLKPIKGIGPILSGGILAWLDPHKADHASSFWRYCGLHVVDGKAIKRQKGKKLGFNVKMRVLAWKIGKSFVRQRTPFYRDIYDKAKLRETEKLGNPIENPQNCPNYKECAKRINQKAKRIKTSPKKLPCKLHIDNRAMRKMVKRFLADLWVTWRGLEGLSVSEPYAIAILGHNKQ